MKLKRIIALICSFVIILNLVLVPVSASSALSSVIVTLWDWFVETSIDGITNDAPWMWTASQNAANDPCSTSPTGHHDFTLQASPHSPEIHMETCQYCGVTWSSFFWEEEEGFTSQLDKTEASSGIAVTGFSVANIECNKNSYAYMYGHVSALFRLIQSSPTNTVSMIKALGVNDRVCIFGFSYYHDCLLGIFFDSDGCLRIATFENIFGSYNAAYLGVYSLSDLTLIGVDHFLFGGRTFYSESYAVAYPNYLSYDCYVIDYSDLPTGTSYSNVTFPVYYKSSTSSVFSKTTKKCNASTSDSSVWNHTAYVPVVDGISWDNSRIIVQPTNTDSTSRLSALANSLNQYNLQHNIQDNDQHVNFVLVPVDVEPSQDTAVSPAIYDEEELVYTDPVTGAEYLTNGWTYDYLTRCYTLDMADGFTIGDAAIDTIKLTYGDELLTVEHYSGGSLIQTDEYNYVMMSGSECGLNGHTYTYEETKTPTCTSTGERKYTCSVCGNEYAEHLPMKEHAYTYSVLKEPTCIDPGISVYTCSTCGNQVTENTDALGHDWQETSSTTTTYTVPEGTSCPDCAGADYALELDEDNGVYRLTCNGCGAVWVVPAEITYGATVYTCTRCGATKTESDDPDSGLFNAIGDLIADGITWVTDKLAELINSLTVMMENFNAYLDSVKNSGGQFPAFLAAIFGLFPQDFMNVVWFSLIALVVLLVWKKWFS